MVVRRRVVWGARPFRGDWVEGAQTTTTFRLWTDDRLRYERELCHPNPFQR